LQPASATPQKHLNPSVTTVAPSFGDDPLGEALDALSLEAGDAD
jgi:hypothetical protein